MVVRGDQMETHNEIEFKTMLTEQEYTHLLSSYSFTSYTQFNDYLDTATGSFSKQKKGLRIRTKNGQYEVTVKTPTTELETLEQNWSLSKKQYEEFKQTGDLSYLHEQFSEPLQSIGSMETLRHEMPYKSGVIMVDFSKFLHTHDYELEFEVPVIQDGEREFHAFLQEHSIPYRPAKKKLVRMKEAMTRV